ncbi:RCC1 and BTB domain-containing protein 1 [Hondaea fermentalgiana]|uniref:RCC1 and BTB domain-containing protein 1 n=1 Tax=Hondaea fermentalgiana TaxID=2315210 RepID=A0A2R5GBI1_9STRA|nr:RCC1 and BTB domain-containing protein 1 [Hondaea fermentalgiana]|eukprot:GBG25481.1 RCC1 and BTB domain-containing protein 1 [Hondaea fermentalgiana]
MYFGEDDGFEEEDARAQERDARAAAEAKAEREARLAAIVPTLADFPLLACGTNGRGHLGHEDPELAANTAITEAKAVKRFPKEFRVGSVSCSANVCLVSHQSTGELYVCKCDDRTRRAQVRFEQVKVPKGLFVLDTATTSTTRFLISGKRQLYSWGEDRYGQLGRPGPKSERDLQHPALLRTVSSFRMKQVAAGRFHVLALSNAGVVFAWGRNNAGQLGLGDRRNRNQPCSLDVFDGCRVVAVAAGPETSAACGDTKLGRLMGKYVNAKSEKRLLFTWGRADGARLGHSRRDGDAHDLNDEDDSNDQSTLENQEEKSGFADAENAPSTLVPGMSQPYFVPAVAALRETPEQPALGDAHGVCLLSSGQCVSWGQNDVGQLGLAHMYTESEPVLIEALSNIVQVSCGPHHSIFLASQGVAFATGYNHYGELGLGDRQLRLTPEPMMHLVKEGVKPQNVCCGPFLTLMWTRIEDAEVSLCFQEDLRQRQCKLGGDPRAPDSIERCAASDGFTYMALAGPCMTKGSYTWQVRVDAASSEESALGIGVAGAKAMEPFIFDSFDQGTSWLYMSSGEIMHQGTVDEYAEAYFERDVIGVHLDLDLGTLQFSRRGKDLGLAYYVSSQEPLYLCVSLPSEGDKVTLLPPLDDALSALQDPGTMVSSIAVGLAMFFCVERVRVTARIEVTGASFM